MSRRLFCAIALLCAYPCLAADSTLKKWSRAAACHLKKWHAASKYAQTVCQHPAIPAAAGTAGLVGSTKTLLDAHVESDDVARRNLTIIGLATLLSSLDASFLAADSHVARRSKKGEGLYPTIRSRLTHLLLGTCRIALVIAPVPALWSEYTEAAGYAVYGDENAKQKFVIKRVLPYLLPALVSGTKGVQNLLRAIRPKKKTPLQLCELSPTNAPRAAA